MATYQPLPCSEEESFHKRCFSLNKKKPIFSREKLHTMLQSKYVETQMKMKKILENRCFAITTDSWTSIATHGYITCTAHFVNEDTWLLHSLVLGIFLKSGASTASDTVAYVESQMDLFGLQYKDMVAVVTDTEATMISAGQIFINNSIEQGGVASWHDCVDHLLELVTGIAFQGSKESEGTMRACRNLVNFL
jgi:hypothetical protein